MGERLSYILDNGTYLFVCFFAILRKKLLPLKRYYKQVKAYNIKPEAKLLNCIVI